MTCSTISDANPDIAGIGIIVAFGTQAFISLLLSAVARALLSNHIPLTGWNKRRFWKELLGGGNSLTAKEGQYILDNFVRPMLGLHNIRLGTDAQNALRTSDPIDVEPSESRKVATTVFDYTKKMIIDIGTSGLDPTLLPPRFIGYPFLGPMMDSVRRDMAVEARRNRIRSEFSKEITRRQEKIQELICRVLLVASDAQTLTGIALIITAMVQQRSLSLYHLHVIYDTVNFTTVSNIAAISCVYDSHLESQRVRYFSITLFGLLYIGFTIMFGVRLNDWDDKIPGRCYTSSRVALSNARHPSIDQAYLGVTSFYVFSLMLAATVYCRVPSQRLYWQKTIITTGALQFLLHVYILVALRISNQSLLDNVTLEDQWGFGQVIAIIMLAATLLECAKGVEEYFSWNQMESIRSREAVRLEDFQAGLTRSTTFP